LASRQGGNFRAFLPRAPAFSPTGRRRALLRATLGFACLELQPAPSAFAALKGWLGSWRGIGAIVEETEHSPTGATGSAWEPTAARAVQRAAWQALTRGGDAEEA
jgi:hypothetical protein